MYVLKTETMHAVYGIQILFHNAHKHFKHIKICPNYPSQDF